MKKIDRNNNKFDAFVILFGDITDKGIFRDFLRGKIIAADGAAQFLFNSNIIPDVIIGDMDSIELNDIPEDYDRKNIISDKNQENTDFEKILDYCILNQHYRIMVLGIHGGDLDHSLNNLSIVKKYHDKLDIWFLDNNKKGCYITESFEMKTSINEMISLIPFPKATLTTENLKWNLKNENLELGVRDGARNRATSTSISVQIHEGGLFLIF